MFNKGTVEKNEERFFEQQGELNKLLQAATVSYNNGDNFYREYSDFITTLSQTFEELQAFSQQQLTTYASNQEEAKTRSKKDGDFSRDAEEFIRGKTQDLIKKNKFQEELKAKMKEALANLDAKKVAKLKVKETQQLGDLFRSLFKVFYTDAKEEFDWAKFSKAIQKDKLEDFQNRLVNADFATLNLTDVDGLIKIKDDAWYDNFAKTDKAGAPVMEILNYLEFVRTAAATQNEINTLTSEITRIKVDAPIRGEKAKSDANWAELLQQNITHLENLNARMIKSAEPFAQEAQRTNEQATAFDQHKREVQELVQGEYAGVQYVPREIYQSS